MMLQKQQVAWWLKCFDVTNMAWVQIFEGIFFRNVFQNPQKRAGLGLIMVACNCLTFRYIKILCLLSSDSFAILLFR